MAKKIKVITIQQNQVLEIPNDNIPNDNIEIESKSDNEEQQVIVDNPENQELHQDIVETVESQDVKPDLVETIIKGKQNQELNKNK